MGVILFFLWSRLDFPLFGKACLGGLGRDFCGQKETGGLGPYVFFGLFGKVRNRIALEDEELSMQS